MSFLLTQNSRLVLKNRKQNKKETTDFHYFVPPSWETEEYQQENQTLLKTIYKKPLIISYKRGKFLTYLTVSAKIY